MTDKNPDIPAFMEQMAESIRKTATLLDTSESSLFLHQMLTTKRVYVAGAGRSGLIARAFAMRLMHLGVDAFVVGETITPAMGAGNTLVMFSGSGQTHSMVSVCETAHELGGKIYLITASQDSPMSRIADCVINLGDLTGYYHETKPSFEVRQVTGEYRSTSSAFAPLGTLFETLALVFSDAIISAVIVAKKEEPGELKSRLATTE
jgi:6-phospho-3-hexuloisomerase